MNPTVLSAWRRNSRQQWSALGLSVALGGLLVALLFAGLRPAPASAAADAVYSCDQIGLNNALAAGGSATFSCGGPTTVPVSDVKTVAKNVTLDGGNSLILSGSNLTPVFTVATGVHLNLINLTVRDAAGNIGGGVHNNGFLAITHTQFISNLAVIGAAIYNAPGAWASISGSTIASNLGKGGVVWNGALNFSNQVPATMTIAGSVFISNSAAEGAAIFNQAGPVTVSGSAFTNNVASTGGAILSFSTLKVDDSHFFFNRAGIVLDSQVQAIGQAAGLGLPSGAVPSGVGGAIYASSGADVAISTSGFSDNLSGSGGGAVYYGFLLPTKSLPTSARLSIASSTFLDNCTGGPGGALGSSLSATVSTSSFSGNFADSSTFPCIIWAANRLNLPAHGGDGSAPLFTPVDLSGSGGAIFNSGVLAVDDSTFLDNAATFSATGGGGAISSYLFSILSVGHSTFHDNTAAQDGGALFIDGGALATVAGSDFVQNRALNNSGGAVATVGTLTITDSSFARNEAPGDFFLGGGGAIYVADTLTSNGPSNANGAGTGAPQIPQGFVAPARLFVGRGTFISNSSAFEGGAIDGGHISVVDSTFLSNSAEFGGAMNIWKPGLTLSASTFIANAATAQGGALDTNNSTDSILNSTFYQNSAQGSARGGAINNDISGTLWITNSTFLSNTAATAGHGGAIAQAGVVNLHNTLVAFSAGGNCNTALTLNGANLEFPGSTCGGASVNSDPRALAPANNGGPTLTSALLPNSPAINSGDDSGCPATDQRGGHRPFGAHCDIGAYEFGSLVARLWFPIMEK